GYKDSPNTLFRVATAPFHSFELGERTEGIALVFLRQVTNPYHPFKLFVSIFTRRNV
ncbi:MAG: hypothetical protein ACI89U_002716, partial [Gammaproteobacteria bacterium]